MSAIAEAMSILLNWIRLAWDIFEPILGAPENVRWMIATLIVVALAVLSAIRRWRKFPAPKFAGRVAARLGPAPSLLAICEYLNDLTRDNLTRLALDVSLLPEASAIVEGLKDQSIRLYVFGLQNAGKSTFINALLGKTFAPEFPGKKTTVLVRYRQGATPQLILHWPDGTREENLPPASLSKRMARWSQESQRVREAIVESPLIDLGIPHLELVDSPGTGSAWTSDPAKSIEDEIVDRATRMAAVAVVVYRYDLAEMEDHERLLKELGENKIPTIGICNLKADWAQAYRADPDGVEHVIASAEARLKKLAHASCYRIDLKQDSEMESLVQEAGGSTVPQLRAAVVKFIAEQRNLVARQALRRCNALISELQARAEFWIGRAGPIVDSIENQRLPIVNATATVLALVSNPVGQGRKATAIASGTGGILGLAAAGSAAIPPAAPVIIVATGIAAGVGALIGWLIDSSGIRAFRKELGQHLRELGTACREAHSLVPASFAARFDALAKNPNLEAATNAIQDLDSAVKRKLDKFQEYHVFAAAKDLHSDLQEVRAALQNVARE